MPDRLLFLLAWRRKRLQRDFSTILAVLLDSEVPESEAVTLANRAGGIVVGKLGTATVSYDELFSGEPA